MWRGKNDNLRPFYWKRKHICVVVLLLHICSFIHLSFFLYMFGMNSWVFHLFFSLINSFSTCQTVTFQQAKFPHQALFVILLGKVQLLISLPVIQLSKEKPSLPEKGDAVLLPVWSLYQWKWWMACKIQFVYLPTQSIALKLFIHVIMGQNLEVIWSLFPVQDICARLFI